MDELRIGSRGLFEHPGDRDKAVTEALNALRQAFRPEFLNRIDDIVVFDALTRADITKILKIQMKRVERLLADRQLLVQLSDAAAVALADAGFDPAYGARPLKRAIQSYLLNPMAKAIVSGGYGPGDPVAVDMTEDDQISFTRIPAPIDPDDDDDAPRAAGLLLG